VIVQAVRTTIALCGAVLACACQATRAGDDARASRRIEQVTTAPYDEYHNRGVTPDGRWISVAYSRDARGHDGPTSGAAFVNVVTGERVELAAPLTNCGSFSHDGRYFLAAHRDASGRTEVIEHDRETGVNRTLAPSDAWEWMASYSPDDRSIVFNSDRDGQMDLFLLERDTDALRRLTTDPRFDAHAAFSPDGQRIVFHRLIERRDGVQNNFDLVMLDLESGLERQLTTGPTEEMYPAFAPDGAHIVFSADFEDGPEQHSLYLLGPDGAIHERLTSGAWKDSYAYWSPDGAYIYFNSNRDGPSNIYRMPMEGVVCLHCAGR
jgi:Tol biopolymer transport system component